MSFFSLTAHCPPPHVHLAPPRRLTPSEALSHIESYLAKTAEEPHLHPDCRFNESGPTLDGRPPGGGIALHQLGRIVRGLKGERLGPEVEAVDVDDDDADAAPYDYGGGDDGAAVASQRDLLPAGDDSRLDALIAATTRQRGAGTAGPDEDGAAEAEPGADTVDKSYNEQMREQGETGILEGEIGARDTGLKNDATIPKVKATAGKEERRSKKRKLQERADEDGGPGVDAAAERGATSKKARKEEKDGKKKDKAQEAPPAEPAEVDEAEVKEARRHAKKEKKKKKNTTEQLEQNSTASDPAPLATNGSHPSGNPPESGKSKKKETRGGNEKDDTNGERKKEKKKKKDKHREKSVD